MTSFSLFLAASNFYTHYGTPTFPILNIWLHNLAFQCHNNIKTSSNYSNLAFAQVDELIDYIKAHPNKPM
jgi:hypothetical protein